MAVLALNALVGNLNADGGIRMLPLPDYISWPDPEMDQIASEGITQPRLDGAGTEQFFHTRSLPNRFFQQIESGQKKVPEMLLIADANPLFTLRDTKAVKAALDQIPFIVSFSSFMDETAQQADLILPRPYFFGALSGCTRSGWVHPAVYRPNATGRSPPIQYPASG